METAVVGSWRVESQGVLGTKFLGNGIQHFLDLPAAIKQAFGQQERATAAVLCEVPQHVQIDFVPLALRRCGGFRWKQRGEGTGFENNVLRVRKRGDTDGINQQIRFSDGLQHLFEFCIARGVLTVGDDQNSAFVVMAGTDLDHAFGERVVKRGAAGGGNATKRLSEFFAIVGEILTQNRPAGKRHEEDFVIRMDAAGEALDSFDGRADFSVHAAARVQQDSNTDGHVLVLAEVDDLLRLPVLFKDEIVDREIGDEASSSVGNRRDHIHQANIDSHLRGNDGCQREQDRNEPKRVKPSSHLNYRSAIILRFGYHGAPMVTPDLFRQVMGNFATGITVVTTRDSNGNPYGLTVNSFTSVSLDPVLVLVCLDNRLSGLKAFLDSKRFGVNILSENQEDLSRMFAKKDAERPPSIYFEGKLGMPLLKNSIAVMECATVRVYEGGDHQIFLGEVQAAEVLQLDPPLMYFRGKYQRIGKT